MLDLLQGGPGNHHHDPRPLDQPCNRCPLPRAPALQAAAVGDDVAARVGQDREVFGEPVEGQPHLLGRRGGHHHVEAAAQLLSVLEEGIPVGRDRDVVLALQRHGEADHAPGDLEAEARGQVTAGRIALHDDRRGAPLRPHRPQGAGLARTGSAASTIQRRLAAISQIHQLAGHVPPPTADWEVRQVVQGIRRRLGTAPAQKEAVLTATLRRLVATCDPAPPPTRAGARDRALLLIGFGAALRRSELVALDVEDVTETDEGLRVRIRRSKTDPEAGGAEVGIVRGQHPDIDPVRALRTWREVGAITTGPLFRPITRADTVRSGRLSGQTVALIVQRTAERAGLPAPEAFAGHSLRSGCATQAAVEGAPERAIMRQGRWRSSATVRRYIRSGDLWQENASAWLGLYPSGPRGSDPPTAERPCLLLVRRW